MLCPHCGIAIALFSGEVEGEYTTLRKGLKNSSMIFEVNSWLCPSCEGDVIPDVRDRQALMLLEGKQEIIGSAP